MNLREGEEVLSTQFHFNAPAQCECACIQFNIYIVEHIIYLFTLMDGAQGAVAKAKWFFSWRKHWEKKAEIHFWRVARKSFSIKIDNNKQSKRISFVLCVCVRAPTEFLPKYWTAYYCCSLLWFHIERFDVSLMLLHPVYIHSSYLINLFSPAAAFIYLFSPFFPSLSFRFISSICQ